MTNLASQALVSELVTCNVGQADSITVSSYSSKELI